MARQKVEKPSRLVSNGGDVVTDVQGTTFDDSERHLLRPTRRSGKHKGKIPAAVIRAAVKKVAAERRRKTAEAERSSAASAG